MTSTRQRLIIITRHGCVYTSVSDPLYFGPNEVSMPSKSTTATRRDGSNY